MLSRGKILVKMSLQQLKQSSNGDPKSRHFIIKEGNLEEQHENEGTAPDDSAVLMDKDETYTATVLDMNDNSKVSDYSDIEDGETELDFDDDVKDPDWKARASDSSDTDSYEVDGNQPNVIDHEEIIDDSNKKSKRKQVAKDTFMREKQKQKRMRGEQYKGVKKDKESGVKSYCVERAERLLSPRNCSKRCAIQNQIRRCPLLEEQDRQSLFVTFWKNMTWKEKKVYVVGHVEQSDVSQRTTKGKSRRKFTYRYYLTKRNERIPVCKNLFLSTLGIGEKTVYNWMNSSDNGIPKPAEKGNRFVNEEYKAREESAKEFLISLPKVDSHYCRASSKKKYLEPVFTSLNELYLEYKRDCNENGKSPYYKTGFYQMFKDMNLSLWQPKKDQCDKCCEYSAGNLDEESYKSHIKKKDEARESKTADKNRAKTDPSVKVLCVDLQSLLICPNLQASALYYKMKLSCHNFTVYDLVTNEASNYFWHEGEGELNANAFASCIIDHLNKMRTDTLKEIIIYSDGCTYQNRNATLANALLLFSVKNKVNIYQKYLERGHTQMECDSVHSCIERKFRGKSIYVPQNYVEKILEARRVNPYSVNYVDHTFLMCYDSLNYYTSIRPGTGTGSSVVTDIRLLKYQPDGSIQYMLNYSDDEFKDIPKSRGTRTRVALESDKVGRLYTSSIPIKKTKFQHLQQLKAVLPKDYHGFYDTLLHT